MIWYPCSPRDSQESSPIPQWESINSSTLSSQHPNMTTGKTIALTIWKFVIKVKSLTFNMLSKFVIAFLPRSKHLLISWLKSPSAVTLKPKKIKSVTFHTFPHPFAMKWWDQMPWSQFFECWVLSQLFHSSLLPSSRGSLVPLWFLSLEWYHLQIWSCCYFSQQSWFQLVFHPARHFTWCTLHEVKWSESHSDMSDSLRPHELYSPCNSPGQNTGMGSLSLLQWIFPIQESNSGVSCIAGGFFTNWDIREASILCT